MKKSQIIAAVLTGIVVLLAATGVLQAAFNAVFNAVRGFVMDVVIVAAFFFALYVGFLFYRFLFRTARDAWKNKDNYSYYESIDPERDKKFAEELERKYERSSEAEAERRQREENERAEQRDWQERHDAYQYQQWEEEAASYNNDYYGY